MKHTPRGVRVWVFVSLFIMALTPLGFGAEAGPQVIAVDADRLLENLGEVKPFKTEGGESPGYSFTVSTDEFRSSLLFLPAEQTDEVMKGFVGALAFSFKENTQFLMLTQWVDHTAADGFKKVEQDLWRLKDKEFQKFLKNVDYGEITVSRDEKAFLSRKVIDYGGQQYEATTFVTSRGDYLIECTLIGSYTDKEIKGIITQIWKAVERAKKK